MPLRHPRRPDPGSEPYLLPTLGTLPRLSEPHRSQSYEKSTESSSRAHCLAGRRGPGPGGTELGRDCALSAADSGVSSTWAGERGPGAAAGPPHSVAAASRTGGGRRASRLLVFSIAPHSCSDRSGKRFGRRRRIFEKKNKIKEGGGKGKECERRSDWNGREVRMATLAPCDFTR